MFGHGARHPDAGLAQVMGRVEQAIEFFGRQLGTDLRLFTQHGAQVALFGHSALAALLQQVMGVVAAQALGEDDAHRFGQHQALGQVEVTAHARGIHFHALGNHLGLAQRTRYQAADVRQGFPFGMPQTEAALVLLGFVLAG